MTGVPLTRRKTSVKTRFLGMAVVAGFCSIAQVSALARDAGTGAISEDEARSIALTAAGCREPAACVVRGYRKDGNWVFVVSFVAGHHPRTGEPLLTPGAWVGVTVGPDGNIVDRTPGV